MTLFSILVFMKTADYRLGFIGFGHMAQVIFKAIDRAKLIPRSHVSFIRRDPGKMKQNEQEFGITSTSLSNLVEKSDILILGVRPNQAHLVLEDLAQIGVESKKVISMLAGIKLAYYQKFLGPQIELLRIMPNIAAEVGEGMTIFTYGSNSSMEFRSLANLLFSCMGEVIEVPESLTDICCGIAGSGPGFVFRLIDAMARAGEHSGLPYPKALKMAAQTFAGAARLILKGALPERLVQQIAVPYGTTEAGFKVMREKEIEKTLGSVVQASARRSKELSEEYL